MFEFYLLGRQRCIPGLVDVLVRHLGQNREISENGKSDKKKRPVTKFDLLDLLSNIVSARVSLLPECDWAVDAVILVEKGGGRQPHPVAGIQRPIGVKEKLLKDFLACIRNSHFHEIVKYHSSIALITFFPRDPQISSCEKASDCMPGQVVYPALLAQLRHNRVNEGIAGAGLCPRLQVGLIRVPRDLFAYRVA